MKAISIIFFVLAVGLFAGAINAQSNNGNGNGNGHSNGNGNGHTSHGNGNGYGHQSTSVPELDGAAAPIATFLLGGLLVIAYERKRRKLMA